MARCAQHVRRWPSRWGRRREKVGDEVVVDHRLGEDRLGCGCDRRHSLGAARTVGRKHALLLGWRLAWRLARRSRSSSCCRRGRSNQLGTSAPDAASCGRHLAEGARGASSRGLRRREHSVLSWLKMWSCSRGSCHRRCSRGRRSCRRARCVRFQVAVAVVVVVVGGGGGDARRHLWGGKRGRNQATVFVALREVRERLRILRSRERPRGHRQLLRGLQRHRRQLARRGRVAREARSLLDGDAPAGRRQRRVALRTH
mmetsp:Transcript_1838/g.6766  ORF Transcript_1838/g.6766 Transcript_1838/m.6766 type:complete len:257 (+) Transcript_1838:1100-1870(+)